MKERERSVDLNIQRTFSTDREKTKFLLIQIVSIIRDYLNKDVVDESDDQYLEKLIYWVADFVDKSFYPYRTDVIINQLYRCRDRYLKDNLYHHWKEGDWDKRVKIN